MSHSANTVSSHRLHPVEKTEIMPPWEIHVGMTGFLYIVGPGPTAMQCVAREMNLMNLALANRVVHLLNHTRREDTEAGPKEIIEALIACGWEEEI